MPTKKKATKSKKSLKKVSLGHVKPLKAKGWID